MKQSEKKEYSKGLTSGQELPTTFNVGNGDDKNKEKDKNKGFVHCCCCCCWQVEIIFLRLEQK